MIPVHELLQLKEDYTVRCQTIKDGDQYPFYSWACKNVEGYKTVRGNLAFRKRLLKLAADDIKAKNDIYAMCSRDMLFYINTFCIAAGTRVVTGRGLIAIEDVLSSDLVWDGDSWVSQKGVLHKGSKSVIMAYGIKLTPNHKVRTNHGWTEAIQGYDREEIRLPNGYSEKWSIPQHDTGSVVGSVRVREGMDSRREQLASGSHCELRVQKRGEANNARVEQGSDLCRVDEHEREVSESKQHVLLSLRREGNTDRPSLDEFRELPERYGETENRANTGTHRQQRELRKVELQVGYPKGTGEQHKKQCVSLDTSGGAVCQGSSDGRRDRLRSYAKATGNGFDGSPSSSAEVQQVAEVYDLLNCGPKHAFTVIGVDGRPLLVHNCYTYDPRLLPLPTEVPFVTYDFQDVALDDIKQAIDAPHDELTEKSRGIGASWMYLTVFAWFFHFKDYVTFRLLSENERKVDDSIDPDALFWKLRFWLTHLVSWLAPNCRVIMLNILNEDNMSTLTGCATTSDAARGGRCTAMLPDEFAAVPDGHGMLESTQHVTKCRLFNSTHKGAATAFYMLSVGTIKKLTIHWSVHPIFQLGLYHCEDGKVIHHDDFEGEVTVTRVKYNYPEEYPYRKDGKLRSPWYDNECDRATHTMQIAQELDMDPFSSDFQFFDPVEIARIEKENVCHPFAEGELEFDEDSLDPLGFVEGKNGPLKLWIYPDMMNRIDRGLEIGCGADVSAGTGASNSTMTFVNLRTGEKIAEWANPFVKPEHFAKIVIAYCKYFNDAFLVFDASGPTGEGFSQEIMRLGYRNLYYRRNEQSITKKVSDKPGIFLNTKPRAMLLILYRRSLKDRTFIQRSHEANQECLEYIQKTSEEIIHSSAVNNIDPSGAGMSHGDRCIADCCAAKCVEFLGLHKQQIDEGNMPENCYAARQREKAKKAKEEKSW